MNRSTEKARVAAIDIAALVLLCAAEALPYYSSELGQDAVRDLLIAEKVSREHVFVSAGPAFDLGRFALGPIWFYVLALPSFFGASIAISALYVGALASLKIPLAFRYGVFVGDRRFAWCLVAAICWPGVQAYQWLWWSCPNVLEACLWGSALTLVRATNARPPRIRAWIPPAALFGLSVHAHPTALLYAPVLLLSWWAWIRSLDRPHRARNSTFSLLVIVAAFAVWFVPNRGLYDTASGDSALSGAVADTVQGAMTRAWQIRPAVENVLWNYPIAAWQSWEPIELLSGSAIITVLLFWYALIAVGCLLALYEKPSLPSGTRLLPLIAAAAVLAGIGLCTAAVLRPWVAFYTAFAVVPALSVVQAGALWMLWAHGRKWSTVAVLVALAWSLGGACWLSLGASQANVAGVASLPLAPLGNLLKQPPAPSVETLRVRQSPHASKVISDWLCKNQIDAVHGTAALALAGEHGLFHDRYCGSAPHPFLLGRDLERHVVGLPSGWLRLAGRDPLLTVDGLGLASVRGVLHPEHGFQVSGGFSYFEDVTGKLPAPADITLRFSAPDDSAVLLTSLKPWRGTTEVIRATRDGEPIEASALTAIGAIWLGSRSVGVDVPSRPSGADTWTFEIRTDVPQWVDVVTF